MALTETELQTQWKNGVKILEDFRAHVDGSQVGTGNNIDTLLTSLEGDITPTELSAWATRVRSAMSSVVDSSTVQEMLAPLIFEYAQIIEADAGSKDTPGSGLRDLGELFDALYEWFHDNTLSVETRAITYGTAVAGTNKGDGTMTRLTEDENGYKLEACHAERKIYICIADQQTGTDENAEVFEMHGAQASFDALERSAKGSGEQSRTLITEMNAGTGPGGSLLSNSSFSTFDATTDVDEKFAGWTQTYTVGGVAADVTQDLVNTYRTFPNEVTSGSLKIAQNAAADAVKLSQNLADMRIQRINPNVPYFLRVMWNRSIGTATIGTLTIWCGKNFVNVTLAAQSGWQELVLPMDKNLFYKQFKDTASTTEFAVSIQWGGGTSGTLLIDDVIFAPMQLIDGTYWALRGNDGTPTPWSVGDKLIFTDTGGAPATGKVQWFNFVSGLGYLPSNASPTMADPA